MKICSCGGQIRTTTCPGCKRYWTGAGVEAHGTANPVKASRLNPVKATAPTYHDENPDEPSPFGKWFVKALLLACESGLAPDGYTWDLADPEWRGMFAQGLTHEQAVARTFPTTTH